MIRRLLYTVMAALAIIPTQAADPQITNITAAQRPGSYLVDITYDVADSDSPTVYVFMEISVDGGASFPLPGFPATGDLGHLTPGANKRITWSAWDHWAGNFTESAKVRLTAVETRTIVPDPGFPAPSPTMMWIPAGTFSHGARNVLITQGFWMGKYEVTQSEYESVTGSNPSQHRGANRPVEMVLWSEANTYCQQLTARERNAGRLPADWEYRLPTEAQWEYASLGGVNADFFFGAQPIDSMIQAFAWYNYQPGEKTRDVGQKGPNPYGLYDIYGNVHEMTLDGPNILNGGNYTDPFVPAGNAFIYRGGSFSDLAGAMNSRFRGAWEVAARADTIGFRVVAVQIP